MTGAPPGSTFGLPPAFGLPGTGNCLGAKALGPPIWAIIFLPPPPTPLAPFCCCGATLLPPSHCDALCHRHSLLSVLCGGPVAQLSACAARRVESNRRAISGAMEGEGAHIGEGARSVRLLLEASSVRPLLKPPKGKQRRKTGFASR